jgi:hypothetical protein
MVDPDTDEVFGKIRLAAVRPNEPSFTDNANDSIGLKVSAHLPWHAPAPPPHHEVEHVHEPEEAHHRGLHRVHEDGERRPMHRH